MFHYCALDDRGPPIYRGFFLKSLGLLLSSSHTDDDDGKIIFVWSCALHCHTDTPNGPFSWKAPSSHALDLFGGGCDSCGGGFRIEVKFKLIARSSTANWELRIILESTRNALRLREEWVNVGVRLETLIGVRSHSHLIIYGTLCTAISVNVPVNW